MHYILINGCKVRLHWLKYPNGNNALHLYNEGNVLFKQISTNTDALLPKRQIRLVDSIETQALIKLDILLHFKDNLYIIIDRDWMRNYRLNNPHPNPPKKGGERKYFRPR